MKRKTAELTGAALDWAVAMCEGKSVDCEIHAGNVWYGRVTSGLVPYRPSTNWNQGGPIIDLHVTKLEDYGDCWGAEVPDTPEHYGPTPLIAAMRCYVASKLGDEMEVPDELA